MTDKLTNFRYEHELEAGLKQIVCGREALDTVIDSANIPPEDKMQFSVILGDALGDLNEENCAEHGLSREDTLAWMNDGRPAGSKPSAPAPDHSEDPGAVMPYRDSDHSS